MALHTKGGWMYYQYLGPGINDPTKLRYKIGLNQYMICNPSGGQLDDPINFSFFSATIPYNFIQDVSVSINTNNNTQNCTAQACHPCISLIPSICYKIVNYETIVELAVTPDGYIVSKQRCCRVPGLSNVPNSSNVGTTYTITIPGTATGVPNSEKNSSPQFIFNDTSIVCGNSPFTINFTATDPDADSLVYSFCDAYDGASSAAPNPGTSNQPLFPFVPYLPPYSGVSPLGAGATINPVTGVISGIAPPPGEYVICVCVAEYRNGINFANSRKELHLYVSTCVPLVASSNFNSITCNGFDVQFFDNSSGNPTTFLWNFGDPASGGLNTSPFQNPTHHFTDTGIFQIKLVISINNECFDSITRPLAVYPGFLPGYLTSLVLCVNTQIQFTDTTFSRYAPVNSWYWDFGDPSSGTFDTSTMRNPLHTYALAGTYNVKLVVTNTKGCIDSVTRPITISDPPVLSLFPHDSTYCKLDSLQLTATGTGTFNWTPNTFITGGNTGTPLVFPPVPTRYYVTLTSGVGCISKDSVNVNPLNDLTNAIVASPPNICEEDTLTLTGSSNHNNNVSWQWTPVATLGTPNMAVTTAFPIVTTTYTLTTTWGNNCVAVKAVNIPVKPLAIPEAGPDTLVCSGGQSSVQLNASGGDTYQWTPVTGLSNPNIANPFATPLVPTFYIVAVGVNGCPKLRTDTVFINTGVLPPITVMGDTLICKFDTLTITTTGSGTFLWSPNYNINNINLPNPLVNPFVPTWYHVHLTDAIGCHSDDSVFINVKDHVTLLPFKDTSICRTDTLYLNTISDGLHFSWSPSVEIFTDTSKRPYVIPTVSRVYTVVANIGNCRSSQSIAIKVAPYPAASAGLDKSICIGFSTQLNASGGSRYVWTPITFLDNRFIPNPRVINPFANIRYIVTVSDTLGCPKSVRDTVWVYVEPKLIVGAHPRDTSVVQGQPLQITINALPGYTYSWTPTQWLNNPTIASPISVPEDNIRYFVLVTSPAGCLAHDTVNVQLFKLDADIYVPTAFTPNGDHNNDVLRPILLGMKELTYFRVYNRFGQLVYATSEIGQGWNGIFNGKAQDPATFVWYAQGVTYKGIVRRKKGYAVLIR